MSDGQSVHLSARESMRLVFHELQAGCACPDASDSSVSKAAHNRTNWSCTQPGFWIGSMAIHQSSYTLSGGWVLGHDILTFHPIRSLPTPTSVSDDYFSSKKFSYQNQRETAYQQLTKGKLEMSWETICQSLTKEMLAMS